VWQPAEMYAWQQSNETNRMFIRPAFGTALFLLAMTSIASSDLLWGVNGHPINAYDGVRIGLQLDYLKDLGARSYRVNISYETGASVLASLVEEGKKRGVAILPVITPGGIDLDTQSPEELYDRAKKLAVSLGSRFKNDIRVWELGNEMENYAIINPCETRDDGTQYPCDWGPAGGVSPLDYFGPRWRKASAVLKGLSDGMTEVDPTLRKAMGTAGWGHLGAFERMKADGIKWDISVWHMYGEDPEWAFKELSRYGHPIWVTEFNNPYGSQRGEQQQAEGLRRDMQRLRQLQDKYRVEAAFIYELLDETYWAPSFEAEMGLVRLLPTGEGGWAVGEPKPAYDTVRELILGRRPPLSPRRDCDLAEIGATASGTARQAAFAYCLLLGRNADAGGIERWSAAASKGGADLPDMLVSMLRSEEFTGLYPVYALTDRAYVEFLFRLLLEREADGDGLDAYAGQLSDGSMTREAVANAIVRSSEFRARHGSIFDDG